MREPRNPSSIDVGVVDAALNDPDRLAALHEAAVLDSEAEEAFDRFTRLASTMLGAPVALLSFVTGERQFFKSAVGIDVREVPLSHSFCQYVVARNEPLVVADARLDGLLHDNLAVPELGVVAYAGTPVKDPGGHVLGSFCVIDSEPREWTPTDLASLADIAAAVQGELMLRDRNRELLRQRNVIDAVLASIQDSVVATDATGAPILMNDAFRQLLRDAGHDPSAPDLARLRSGMRRYRTGSHPSEPVESSPGQLALRGELVRGMLLQVGLADGTDAIMEASAAPLRDGQGSVFGAVTTLHDVTDKVIAERMKEEFFALVSHELRTPLAAIIGYLELLEEDEADSMTPDGRSFVEAMGRQSHRLLRLIGDLLFAAQVEAGTMNLVPSWFSPDDMVRDAAQAARLRTAGTDVEVLLELAEPCLPFWGDGDRIAQVLDNLLTNAVKFTEAGTVTLRARSDEDGLVLEVQDTGFGISEADQQRLFHRFARAAAAKERSIPGVGLGLAITRAIVDGHGGDLQVDSTVGVGSTFRVTFPAAAAGSEAAWRPSQDLRA